MRRAGVRDARKDTDAMNDALGTNATHKGKPGHHRTSVSADERMASDPRNVEFPDDHLAKHGGDYRTRTYEPNDVYRN